MSKYILMVFTGACSYGVLSTLVKLSYREGYHAAEVSFLQALMGAVSLWLIVALQKKKKLKGQPVAPISARTCLVLLLTGAAIGLTTYLYYLSVHYIPASIAIIVLMQFTWMTVLLDWCLLKNAPSGRLFIAIICILIATVMAAGTHSAGKELSWKGVGIAFASALLYALYIVANSRAGKGKDAVTRSAITVSGAAIGIFIANIHVLSGGIRLTPSLLKWTSLLALLGTVIPPFLFAKGIPKVGASVSSILMVAEMPVAIVCSRLVLKEPIQCMQWIGIILMLAAMVYLNINRRR